MTTGVALQHIRINKIKSSAHDMIYTYRSFVVLFQRN